MILGTLILADWLIKLQEGVLCYLGKKGLVLLALISAVFAWAAISMSEFYIFLQWLSVTDVSAHTYEKSA